MNEELLKSVVDLIDETLMEIDDLKKNNRFQASEIKIEGPGECHLDGKPVNGSIEKKEDEKNDDKTYSGEAHKDDDEDDKDKKKKKNPFLDKAEHKEPDADDKPGATEEDDDDDEDDKDMDKNDYLSMVHKTQELADSLKKTQVDMETLMKSYVDERITPIESKLDSLVAMIKELGDSPLPQRGVTYKNVAPMKKSLDEVESLSKSQVCDKLMEMKKSGTKVSSEDIISAELGSPDTLSKIVQKYNLK